MLQPRKENVLESEEERFVQRKRQQERQSLKQKEKPVPFTFDFKLSGNVKGEGGQSESVEETFEVDAFTKKAVEDKENSYKMDFKL